MEQDGRVETSPRSAAWSSTRAHEDGTVLMTLYTASENGTALQHATVPFPESYEAACQQALKSFAVYIPKDTETVSLRRAYKRLDGNVVWSAVHEDDWIVVLKKTGEEIGVFLPDEKPDGIPYGLVRLQSYVRRSDAWQTNALMDQRKPQESLVRINIYEKHFTLRAVGSFEECEAIARSVFNIMGDEGIPRLMYDGRMVGSAERQAAYRRESDTSSMLQNANWEEIHSRELFQILVDMHPEPLVIKIM